MLRAPLLAYVDPGLGAMALQALVAGALGALFFVVRAWRRIVALVRGRPAAEPPKDERRGDP